MRVKCVIGIWLIIIFLLFHSCFAPDGGDAGDGGATDNLEWEKVTTTSIWSARSGHQAVVFNYRIWVMGGYDGTNRLNDVWCSENGEDWAEVKGITSIWSARSGHQAVVFNDRIWVMGGYDGMNRLNDVWYSENGEDWVKVKIESTIWQGRTEHLVLVFNDSDKENMWVIGGSSGSQRLNDVWYSSDGSTWEEKNTLNPMWDPRTGHTGAVFNGKFWVIDGYDLTAYKNDIWSSSNGSRWIEEVDSNEWWCRAMSSCVTYNDRLWIMGGFQVDSGELFNDVWYSNDGKNWIRAISTTTKWGPRYSMPVVVFEGKMWVLGGVIGDNQRSNEIWKSL